MAYENINVASLRSSINNCLSTINYSRINQMVNQISSDDVWSTNSKNNFKIALDKLIERNKNLENELKKYLTVANLIEEYQKLDKSIDANLTNVSNYKKELSVANQIDKNYVNKNNQNTIEAKNNRQKINNINKELKSLNSKIDSNKSKLSSLKSKIDTLL